ncbi:hypothetical protein Vafri_1716 [Volvox africanus]|nr:hypothetical protein Vafri_1716 [Volvox africanus]
MRCLNPGKLRLLASPCIAVSLISRRELRTCLLATATQNSSILATGSGRPQADDDGGIRFVYEPPRRFVLAALRKRRHSPPTSAKPRIDLLVEGNPLSTSPARVEPLVEAVRSDAAAALQVVLQRKALNNPGWKMPRIALLSLVLCDDPHIRDLNSRHRGKDSATDVLSFELEDDLDYRVLVSRRCETWKPPLQSGAALPVLTPPSPLAQASCYSSSPLSPSLSLPPTPTQPPRSASTGAPALEADGGFGGVAGHGGATGGGAGPLLIGRVSHPAGSRLAAFGWVRPRARSGGPRGNGGGGAGCFSGTGMAGEGSDCSSG